MARKKSAGLTDAELRLMEVIWDRGESTVAEVAARVGKPRLAYSTVLTTLRILEGKGYLRHEKSGRAFVYRPAVGREEARESAVQHLLRRFFGNSAELLVVKLVEGKRVDAKVLARLRRRIAEES